MKTYQVKSIQNIIFFFIIFSLIFCTIPQVMQISISGGFSSKLSWYFIFLGFIISIYEYRRMKVSKQCPLKKYENFMIVYILFTFFSLILGLYSYPFYENILNAPVIQFDKFPFIYQFITKLGINISQKALLSIWMIARPIKQFILEAIFTFGVAFFIYFWSYDNWKTSIDILVKATMGAVCVILLYSCIEIPYLYNNQSVFANALTFINPFIHEIKDGGGWWPPLLWPNQLRSLFAEPSYFGIYASFAMPWIWYLLERETNKKKLLVISTILTLFSFCLFLTKARTAVVLFTCQVIILLFFTGCFHKLLLKKTILILLCSFLGFFGANIFIGNSNLKIRTDSSTYSTQVESYFEDNVSSLKHTNKRSNRARFSIMEANFKMGLDHPWFGVGYSLRHGYTLGYLPTMAFEDDEVNLWIRNQHQKGIIKSAFPCLGEYTMRFAETGIIGLILFLFPSMYLSLMLFKIVISRRVDPTEKDIYVFFIISLLGVLGSGIGESLNVTYCLWVLLGIGYSIIARE